MTAAQGLEAHLQAEIGKVMYGMQDILRGLSIALLNRGHILLEGAPGLGKTRLSQAFARVIGGEFKRIQGTADLMPTDVTGVHIYNAKTQEFEFQPGPIFADVVLVDEINRTGPKTQSALLEAMEERQVSIDRDTYPLAEQFVVMATQNPREFEGTFPLPESQLDRFALCIPVAYLSREHELQGLQRYVSVGQVNEAAQSLTPIPAAQIDAARASLDAVHMADELFHYALDIAGATRDSASVNLGVSMRGALVLAQAARAEAALNGADYVTPDDVRRVAPWVVVHRLVLTPEAALQGVTAGQVLEHVLANVAVPK